MTKPSIAILGGTGSLGKGLATRFVSAGFPVIIGSRDAEKAKATIREHGWAATGASNEDAAREGDIVIVTVPFSQQAALMSRIASVVTDKLVIDTSVPLVPPKVGRVQLPPDGSAALSALRALDGHGRLVTAFHNVSAAKLQSGQPIDADVLVFGAADDRQEAIELIGELGVRALHGGPLENAVAAEAMTSVLITINRRYKIAEGAGLAVTGLPLLPEAKTTPASKFSIQTIGGLPEVCPGDDIAQLATDAMPRNGLQFESGDILVICHKIISKAEGRLAKLEDITVSDEAVAMAGRTGKSEALCEIILSESQQVLRERSGLVITRNRLGHVVANSAVDQSNTGSEMSALLLPLDPDASARGVRKVLEEKSGCQIGVIVTDSFGRAWRRGTLGTAIGLSGPPAYIDQSGGQDRDGRLLQSTIPAVADALAAAAVAAMGEADEGTPMALIRGFNWEKNTMSAVDSIREEEEDLFT